METGDYHKLGKEVLARRRQMGVSQAEVERRGGPSELTIRKIENGQLDGPPRPQTLQKLERALEWLPGTASGIAHGTAGDDPSAWIFDATLSLEALLEAVAARHKPETVMFRDPDTGAALHGLGPRPEEGAIVPSIAPRAMADGLRWLEILHKHYGDDPEFERLREVATSFIVRIGNGEAVGSG
jgi:transcriptional regulator with XRE-family HTH domain